MTLANPRQPMGEGSISGAIASKTVALAWRTYPRNGTPFYRGLYYPAATAAPNARRFAE